MSNGSEHSTAYVWRISMVAALGGLLFGYDTAVIAGTVEYLQRAFALNDLQLGWAASSALVGCILGAFIAGAMGDYLGRKRSLVITAILFFISAVASAFPQALYQLAIARIVGGIGIGAASMLVPMYIAEIAPARIRGRLITMNQVAILIGMVGVYFVNAKIAASGDLAFNVRWGWRLMFLSEALPALLFLMLLFFVPESPRWLLQRGREDDARRVLVRACGETQARQSINDINALVVQREGRLGELFQHGQLRLLVMAMLVLVCSQITGINVVMYYAPRIFTTAGINTVEAIGHTVLIGLIMMAFTLLSLWQVERTGRKRLLISSAIGMGVSLMMMAAQFEESGSSGRSLLFWVLAYVAAFSIGMGPVTWVVAAEILPTRTRGRAMGIAVGALWLANYLVAQFFPAMLRALGGFVFCFFAVMCVLASAYFMFFVPETKGRSLEELEAVLSAADP